ncbi:hypothetical protein [Streptomyces jumonjinensis]|uniref:hypothetical protein n=1 Tax=Streptomyces jumonjinensis TaxID=1945 RepID=UPI003794C5B7
MDRISVTASRRLVAAGHRHGTGPLAVMSAADLAAHAAASHVRRAPWPSIEAIAAAEDDARADLVTAYITATAQRDQITAAHIRYEATLWDLANDGPSLVAELDGTRTPAVV